MCVLQEAVHVFVSQIPGIVWKWTEVLCTVYAPDENDLSIYDCTPQPRP